MRWMSLCGAAVLAACGGGTSSASAVVNGTVGGNSFGAVAEAASFSYSGPECQNASNRQASVYLMLANTGGHCAAFQSGGTQPAGNLLLLGVNASGSTQPLPIGPGVYNVVFLGNPSAFGIAGTVAAAGCQSASYLSGSGTLTLATVNGSGMSGSYDLKFIDGNGNPAGELSGSFNTTSCAVDASKVCSVTQLHSC